MLLFLACRYTLVGKEENQLWLNMYNTVAMLHWSDEQ